MNDKVKHLLVGVAIGATSTFLPLWLAMVLLFSAAAGKEAYDYFSGKGTPEFLDFGATVAGGLTIIGAMHAV